MRTKGLVAIGGWYHKGSIFSFGWRRPLRAAFSLVLSGCLVVLLGAAAGRGGYAAGQEPTAGSEKRVEAFCSACHVMPQAASFPRESWRHEVLRGYGFYGKSGRKDLDAPPPAEAIAYFEKRAPESLDLAAKIVDAATPFSLTLTPMEREAGKDQVPLGLAHLAFGELFLDKAASFYAVDMRRGELLQLERGASPIWRTKLRGLRNPCHFESCDLDGDGQRELVVADLGSYRADDHGLGRVLWVREGAEKGKGVTELLKEVGRVSDVRPADFNQDGKQDLVVAEFGWLKTGGIWLLTQEKTSSAAAPTFTKKRLLDLHGVSHVPVGDFDQDGKLDFAAMLSQEHERVILFRGRGDGEFDRQVIWQAPDPAYGLSSIEPVDLDRDGDLDLLFTSGDNFDGPNLLKPSHGIHWLENEGAKGFVYHRLAYLLGAYSAKAGDLDGDGDLDLVAACWTSPVKGLDANTLPSVVCGRQTAKGEFEMSILHRGSLNFVSLAVGDLDGDGDVDVAAGSHLLTPEDPRDGGVMFLNQQVNSTSSRAPRATSPKK